MSVLVQSSVMAPDRERFVRAAKAATADFEADGARNIAVYEDENRPGMLCLFSEWDSHDAMHISSDKRGDEFNAAAGTEGVEWETSVWQRL